MTKIPAWPVGLIAILVIAAILTPSLTGAASTAAQDKVRGNLEALIAEAGQAQQEHKPFTPEDLQAVIDHLDWPQGTVTYRPRFVMYNARIGTWVFWAEPQVRTRWIDGVRFWAPKPQIPAFCVRCSDLANGVQADVPINISDDHGLPSMVFGR